MTGDATRRQDRPCHAQTLLAIAAPYHAGTSACNILRIVHLPLTGVDTLDHQHIHDFAGITLDGWYRRAFLDI